MRLFLFGYGYTAAALVARLRPRIAWLGASARDDTSEARLRKLGVDACRFTGSEAGSGVVAALGVASHVLVSIPPDADGDAVLRHHGADLMRAARGVHWIGYLSTVGVYGDHGGAWVDEESACRPVSQRSRWRLEAERAWQRLAEESGIPTGIFRLAGIYGPGRNALRKLLEGRGRRIVKPGQVFNRIHVADIAAVLEKAIAAPASRLYNVADDEPAPPQDVVAHAAQLLGIAPPPEIPFQTARLSPMAASFYGENKRVSNRRMREELGVELAFPSYREGLADLLEGERGR